MFRKSHLQDAPYSYLVESQQKPMTAAQLAAATGEGIKTPIAPNFVDVVSTALEANDQDYDDDRRSVFVDKFEDIGMLDPNGLATAPAAKAKPASKSPNKKGGKDGAAKKPSLKKIVFEKNIYPEFKMNNPDQPPTLIYLPSPELVRKMIRACLKVETVEECLDKF